jgi:hypothetical protein
VHIIFQKQRTNITVLYFDRKLQNDLYELSNTVDHISDWREQESKTLSDLVGRRINYLQVTSLVGRMMNWLFIGEGNLAGRRIGYLQLMSLVGRKMVING